MNENLFRKLVDSTRDSIIVIDDSEKVIYWNKSAEEQFGYTNEEVLGKNLHQLILPSIYHKAHNNLHKFRVTSEQELPNKLMEVMAKRKSGALFPVEVSLSSVIVDGQWYAVGVLRDITKRKQNEEEIRKLSRAVEQSPSTVVITDLQGNIVYANPKFTALSGYSLDEIIGKNPNFLKSGKQPASLFQDLWTTISIGEEWRGELLNRKKSGELYWESASFSPIRNHHCVTTHYLKVAEDITDRKHVEQALKKAKEAAEKASLAKSEFLANMSHEIRTPMNVIIGMTEYLLTTDVDGVHHEYISMVNDSAKLLLSIINQILDFSKIEAGKLELLSEPFAFKETITRLMKMQRVSAEGKGIELQLQYDDAVPNSLIGDPVRLQQVLINLVGNAIKFTDEGKIKIKVKLISQEEKQVKVMISVLDTGIGIPQEKLNRLFKSFSQIDNSLARQYEGTGLGLAISKRLVELMGGTIGVKSELGKGSKFSFTVTFDLHDDKDSILISEDNNTAVITKATSEQTHILLAEDKKMNQKLAKLVLEKKGWKVTIANNGREAIQIIERDAFDVILMDIQMPELDGLSVTKYIRSLDGNANQNVPIIAMTANVFESDKEKYLQIGMDDFVSKPFVMEELYETVERHLNNRHVPLGLKEALKSFDGDKQLLKEIVEIFVLEYPDELTLLKTAIDNREAGTIARIAHGIKGQLANLRVHKACELAAKLESLANTNEFLEIDETYLQLNKELKKLEDFFAIEDWVELF
jgi:PAS domain S-box-containing protein